MKKIVFFISCVALIMGCSSNKKADYSWLTSTDVRVAIDETFEPIMSEQIQQFGLTYVDAGMKPLYCSEDSAIRLLVNDSLRSVVVTRPLSDGEKKKISAAGHSVSWSLIASDAFALIVNKQNTDTVISVEELKDIVNGKITRWEQLSHGQKKGRLSLVFDNSSSSTVRYMRDSLCGGAQLQGNVFAQGSNKAVIELVKQNSDAIGVVGTDWLREGDTVLPNFDTLPVKVMLVSRTSDEGIRHFRPYQYYIATGDYPLVRGVYAITTDPRTKSMERNFYFWLKGQKGQLIFCNNSQLLPTMPVTVKAVNVH
ncbi:MAG: substrate-binding domain-containing protein [Alloprevotella sp.]|nr:substrate-binding domain-containing protein [Alloprevotella sp.]